jgi:small basic protein (TIGR04137 family)
MDVNFGVEKIKGNETESLGMSIHKSLKTAGVLSRHRNVLTRLERILRMEDDGKWDQEKNSIYNLPKFISRKAIGKKKKKEEKKAEGEEGVAEGAETAIPAEGAAAAGAKTPGAKTAAPAAKGSEKASPKK